MSSHRRIDRRVQIRSQALGEPHRSALFTIRSISSAIPVVPMAAPWQRHLEARLFRRLGYLHLGRIHDEPMTLRRSLQRKIHSVSSSLRTRSTKLKPLSTLSRLGDAATMSSWTDIPVFVTGRFRVRRALSSTSSTSRARSPSSASQSRISRRPACCPSTRTWQVPAVSNLTFPPKRSTMSRTRTPPTSQ